MKLAEYQELIHVVRAQFDLDTFRDPPDECALIGDAREDRGSVQVCLSYEAQPAHEHVDDWKRTSSEAHLRGEQVVRRRIVPKSPREWSLAQAKCFLDRLHCSGVTPSFGPGFLNSHPHANLLTGYAQRLAYALSQGTHRAQIALLMPECRSDIEAVRRISSDYFDRLGGGLGDEHLDYDVVDEDSLANATSVDQRLMIGREEFELLVLPPITSISLDAAKKIAEFVEDGGNVVATGLIPLQDPSGEANSEIQDIFHKLFDTHPALALEDFERGNGPRLFSVQEGSEGAFVAQARDPDQLLPAIRACLSRTIRPEVSARWHGRECGDLRYVHRHLGDGEFYFFANACPEPREVQLMVRCSEAPNMLDLETGSAVSLPNCTQRGSRTVLLHRFEPYGSLLIYFAPDPVFALVRPTVEVLETPVAGSWNMESGEDGFVYYRKPVHISAIVPGQQVWLTVSRPADAVEVHINGSAAGIRGWAPHEVEVTPYVHAGAIEVELRLCPPDARRLDPRELFYGVSVVIR